jgi:stress responsive alpha/beta barrel protein
MMTHVVLFTPRPDLTASEVARLSTTLDAALRNIPSVRRYQVGRRTRLGTAYDAAAPLEFEYVTIVEFEDRDGLSAYLRHPEHEALGRLFYETSALALAADFETVDGDVASTLDRWRRT